MNIFIELLVIAVLSFLAAFVVSLTRTKHIREKEQEKILREELFKLDEEYQRKVDRLEKDYQREKDRIRDITQSQYDAKLAEHEARVDLLDAEYANLRKIKQNEFANWEEAQDERLRIDYEKKVAQQQATFEAYVLGLNKQIEATSAILEDYKSKQDIINAAIRREKEIAENQDFYRIILSPSVHDDVTVLETIRARLTNREALSKLIYEVFYKRPLADMIARVLENKSFCGIYKITNLNTGEAYIGKSTDIKKRWTEHIKTSLDIGSIAKTKIHIALRDIGVDNFSFEVLEQCPKEIYSERERYWINFYNTQTYGYNIQK